MTTEKSKLTHATQTLFVASAAVCLSKKKKKILLTKTMLGKFHKQLNKDSPFFLQSLSLLALIFDILSPSTCPQPSRFVHKATRKMWNVQHLLGLHSLWRSGWSKWPASIRVSCCSSLPFIFFFCFQKALDQWFSLLCSLGNAE